MGYIPIFQRKVSDRIATKEKELREKNKMCILFVKSDSSKCNIYNKELRKQGFARSYSEKICAIGKQRQIQIYKSTRRKETHRN